MLFKFVNLEHSHLNWFSLSPNLIKFFIAVDDTLQNMWRGLQQLTNKFLNTLICSIALARAVECGISSYVVFLRIPFLF